MIKFITSFYIMKSMHFLRVIVIILAFLCLINSAYSDTNLEILEPRYFNEQDNVFDDIHFLRDEMLSFKLCSENIITNVKPTLSCSGTENSVVLSVANYTLDDEKNCYFSNYNLGKLSCSNIDLKINFIENNKQNAISRKFVEEEESNVINFVIDENYEDLSPIELSYYLLVVGNVETTTGENSILAYNKLRDSRDNSDKCWPENECSVKETSEILRNIKLAGFELDSRILEDGRVYLETNMKDNSNKPYTLEISTDDDIFNSTNDNFCAIEIDNNEDNETINDDSESFNFIVKDTFEMRCDETVEIIRYSVYDFEDRLYERDTVTNTTGFSLDLTDFACIGEGQDCNFEDSINSLITYGEEIENYDIMLDYLVEHYLESRSNRNYVDTDERYLDGGRFLYYTENESILEYLKFKQNNDGSWGLGSNKQTLVETAWSTLGIKEREEDSENVEDGKKWIYYNEPLLGWGDVKKNSLAYLAIKEDIKPYLNMTPINIINDNTIINISNPSLFALRDIRIQFSEDVRENVSHQISLGDLNQNDIATVNFSVSSSLNKNITGYMNITGVNPDDNEITLIDIPINLVGDSSNFVILEKSYEVDEVNTEIEIETTDYTTSKIFSCSYTNPFSGAQENVELSNNVNKFKINNSNLVSGDIELTLDCETNSTSFITSQEFNVEVIDREFELVQKEIVMEEFRDSRIDIISLSEEPIFINVTTTQNYADLLVPEEQNFTLEPGEQKRLDLIMFDSFFLEEAGDAARGNVIVSSENYSVTIPINREQQFETTEATSEGMGIFGWAMIFIGIIVVALIILIIFRIIQRRRGDQNNQQQNTPEENEEDMFIDL